MKALQTEHGVSEMCLTFAVSRSGYYDWCRAQRKTPATAQLDDEIREVYQEHRGRYGSPRVTRVLRQRAIPCSENRVARRMRVLGLAARKRKAWVPRTTDSRHAGPICSNLLLDREPATQPHQVWLGDITYVATGEGWLYLAGFLDVATRQLVGCARQKRGTVPRKASSSTAIAAANTPAGPTGSYSKKSAPCRA